MEQILADRIDEEGGPLVYDMESEEDNSVLSIPLAGGFTDTSANHPAEPGQTTHKFPRRG